MNIFIRELKANFRALLIWGGIMILFIVMAMTKFSAYAGNPEMLEIMDSMPPAILEAFQMNAFNLTTVTGFFGVCFTYFALLSSVYAVMLGSDIISKEERDKTVEFALTLPIPRRKLITSKILAAVILCIAFLVIILGASLVSVAQYQPDREFYDFMTLCMVALLIMQMTFLAIGIFLGCAMRRYKRAVSVAVALLLGSFFLSIISGLNENLEFLKYFSPFEYFSPSELLNEARIDLTFVLISVGIIAISIIGGYLTYERRDLYI
ncbi:MAG: ABC transporter permease subunit [Anaerolineales bacterium]|nr:ABC transporter permease subunit [Anaerolineales bacterium]